MAADIRPWLEDLVATEISTLLAWHRQSNQPGIKPDPEVTRFSYDGSNFRSELSSPPLDSDCKVQLVKVLRCDGLVTALVSDGASQIMARFSGAAVAAFEDEIDDKIDLSLKGDILLLQKVTVITTPYGRSDGSVQLQVHALDYVTTRRKAIGDPRPIQQARVLQDLLDEFLKALEKPSSGDGCLPLQDMPSSPPPLLSSANHHLDKRPHKHADSDGNRTSQRPVSIDRDETPLSQRPARSSPPATAQPELHLQTQLDRQSQTQHSHLDSLVYRVDKRKRPVALEDDGLEIEPGLNLSGPQAAGFKEPRTGLSEPAQSTVHQPSLLGLINKTMIPAVQELSENEDLPRRVRAENDITVQLGTEDASLAADFLPNAEGGDVPSFRSTGRTKQKRIPEDQQALLDKRISWIPSLPGSTFPSPNVAIEILTKWNTAQTGATKRTHSNASSPIRFHSDSPVHRKASNEHLDSEGSTSTPGPVSESDQELDSSQWPPTSPMGDSLPPDSSAQRPPTQSPARSGSLDMAIPRSLGDPCEANRQLRQNHLRPEQRKAWLKSKYNTLPRNAFDTRDAYKAYQSTYPNDPATECEFMEAVRDTFSEHSPTSPQVTRIQKHVEKDVEEKGNVEEEDEEDEEEEQQDEDEEDEAVDSPRAEEASFPMHETRMTEAPTRNSMEEGQGVEDQNPNGPTSERPGSAPPKRASSARSEPIDRTVSPLLRPVYKQPDERKKTQRQSTVMAVTQQPLTTLQTFARDWSKLGSGGAFADGPKQTRQQRKVSVLSWTLD